MFRDQILSQLKLMLIEISNLEALLAEIEEKFVCAVVDMGTMLRNIGIDVNMQSMVMVGSGRGRGHGRGLGGGLGSFKMMQNNSNHNVFRSGQCNHPSIQERTIVISYPHKRESKITIMFLLITK